MSSVYDGSLVGQVFNIQRYSTADGPGVRTTVFLKGCPLRCFWCQNPESQPLKPVLFIRHDKCVHCGRCANACPNGAISRNAEGKIVTDRSKCTACGACVTKCLLKVREIQGEPKTVEEVVSVIRRDKRLYHNSGGGITISGGACEMQHQFTVEILKAAQDEGIHTAVEIEGFFPWNITGEIVKYCDYIMYDIKCIDEEQHEKGTGVTNANILHNAKKIVEMGKEVLFRTPLIPTFNDDKETITAVVNFVRDELGLDPATHLELLPYNNLGEEKYGRMDFEGFRPQFSRQSEEHIEMLNAIRTGACA